MATLLDVAKKAHVSKMTVSRVINHPELVTEELKQLVFQAMDELDYRPNNAAKALAQNRTLLVKVMILEEIDTTEPYYMNLLMGIAAELDKHQYALQLITKNTLDLGECDGYIITGMREDDYEWIRQVQKPVVLFGENRHGLPFVDTDNRKGMDLATEYALSLGYDPIVYIGIDVDASFESSREDGYEQAMARHGKEPVIYRFPNRSTVTREFISARADQFDSNTCFLCSSDRMAFGVEQGLLQAGKKIPEEFGVIGHDGVFLDQIAVPKLTTVKQSVLEMGKVTAQLLLQKIARPEEAVKSVVHPPRLIVRQSTRKETAALPSVRSAAKERQPEVFS